MAAMVLVLTGCPHNEYSVQLQPRGNTIERTLLFYREDGVSEKTGVPNYKSFDEDELATITNQYPAHGVTRDGERHVARGEFTNVLPDDVGGVGNYTNLTTSLGDAGFYAERFRGNDDVVSMDERRGKAADRLVDLVIGWSRKELGREPGYNKLRQFLDMDFRRDLKNFSEYWWEGQLAGGYKTNAEEEFGVRFGQYLCERGYFTIGDIPGLVSSLSADDPQPVLRRIQRLVARKMGVPDSQPVPASLAFLADGAATEKSFDKYLAGTDFYRAKLKQWEKEKKLKPDLKRPEESSVASDASDQLIEFELFGEPDHLVVRLLLPSAPAHSNGRWDEALKEVVWDTSLLGRTNVTRLPVICYASWAQADEAFQNEHVGKVALTGDKLTEYCLWRTSLDAQRGREWDAFLAGLLPGNDWRKKLDAFRFSDESEQTGTNDQTKIPSPSSYPRTLFQNAAP